MWRKTTSAKPFSESESAPVTASSESAQNEVASVPSASAKPREISQAASPVSSAPFLSPAAQPPAPVPAPSNSAGFSIPSGLKIHGTISGSSDLSLDSEMHGKVWLSGARLSIGPNGRVHADIEAREVVVNGNLTGNLKASESVRFGSNARFQGSVVAPRIGIDDGARVRGKVEMARPADASSSESAKSEAEDAPKTSARAAGQVAR